MHTLLAFVVAVALPLRFPMGVVVAPPDLLDMRGDAEPVTTGPQPVEPAPVEPVVPVEPAPVEPAVPAPAVEPASLAGPGVEPVPPPAMPPSIPEPYVGPTTMIKAGRVRDVGVGIMIATGSVMVAGVVLILAGAGVGARAAKQSGCTADECAEDPRYMTGARVTAAGLVFSTLAAVGFVAGLVTYGVGRSRLQRARGSMVVLGPTRSGGALAMRGRF